MKFGLPVILAALLLSLFIAACGGETAGTSATNAHTATADGGEAAHTGSGTVTDVSDSEASKLTGVWNIVTENGSPPAANGYNSLVLTLTADNAFSSAYDGSAGTCTWSGSFTATATTLTLVTDAATGPPCDIAVGSTKTAQATLSADGNALTLDWTAEPMGTLQEYTRVH